MFSPQNILTNNLFNVLNISPYQRVICIRFVLHAEQKEPITVLYKEHVVNIENKDFLLNIEIH